MWSGNPPGGDAIISSIIKSVSFDAADALALARFWAAALGSDVDEDATVDKAFVEASGWGAPNIWFTRVPELKAAKNRVHFDLRAPGPMADEVARLEALGATVVQRFDHLVSMRDPEGNEFCVEPGPVRLGTLTSERRPARSGSTPSSESSPRLDRHGCIGTGSDGK